MRPNTILKTRRNAVLLAALIFISAGYSLAQDTVVEGVVLDRDGQPLKDVQIVFVDRQGGQKFTAKSDKKGKFMRVGMPTGHYLVKAELEGYLPLETDFVLKFDAREKLNLTLDKVPPKISEDADLAEGTRLFQEGKFKESLPFFQRAAEKFPTSFEANYNLGLAYLRASLLDEAISSFNKLKELKPDQVEVYLALGESYFIKGEDEEALSVFAKALELQPENAEIYYNIAIIQYKADKLDEAIQNFTVARDMDPKFAATYYQLALAFLKKGDNAGAIENFEKYLGLAPDSPQSAQVKTILETLKKE
jgi:tetratricopeptide (TPR) repeat protein